MLTTIKRILSYVLFPKPYDVRLFESFSPEQLWNVCPHYESSHVIQTVYTSIYSLFKYKNTLIKAGVYSLKNHKNKIIADMFAVLLYEKILKKVMSDFCNENSGGKIILLPIPLHSKKHKERGYNQCELLCESLVDMVNDSRIVYKPDAIIRIKNMSDQKDILNKKKRIENMKNCFELNTNFNVDLEKSKKILYIIIDDVVTTGATIDEVAKVLLNKRAQKIVGVTIAH